MKIVQRKILDLKEAPYNPRQLTKSEYSDLKRSLKEFGMIDPIIVNMNEDRNSVVIGGHQRVKIWRELGNDTVPCVEVDLTLERERELNIRLNKNTGSWDFDGLANHFDIDNLIDWGFTGAELAITTEGEEEVEDNPIFDEIPDMECRQYENHDYLVLIFDESHDYLFACQKLGIKKVRIPEKKRVGIGRVIDGKKTLKRIFPNEFKLFEKDNIK